MILDSTKNMIKTNLGKRCGFIFHGTRNQNEEFEGTIIKMYPSVFLIEMDNGQIKSFCYSDILISNLEIIGSI